MPRKRHLTGRRAALVGQAIVAATLILTAAVSVGCRTSPSVDAAIMKAVDDYFGGFKTYDATRAADAMAPTMRAALPTTPEEMVARMRANADKYGAIQEWAVDSADVDTDNGQALVTVRVTSTKVIYLMDLDLRRYEPGWLIMELKQKDAVRNPESTETAPRDIGQSNPFGTGIK